VAIALSGCTPPPRIAKKIPAPVNEQLSTPPTDEAKKDEVPGATPHLCLRHPGPSQCRCLCQHLWMT